MARRSDHTRDQLREMILNTAWNIVGNEGYEGLSARRIAGEIGYAPGTIYNLFASMDELCLQINGRILDMLYEALSDPACNDPRNTPAQNMKAMAESYMAFAHDRRTYWLMLLAHRLPEDRSPEEWYRGKVERLFAPLESLLGPLFSDGPAEKEEKTMAARVLWSSVHGLCFLQETGKIRLAGGRPPAELAHYLIDTFVAGLAAAKNKAA